ncbi:MAG: hypothetical protein IKD23_02080 [Lentisphaeria bacterium]|nr:hypothetical protein [Lentisphaeria bacterium]
MAEQFELLFAFVFSDFFPPFLFQVTHFNTSFIDFLPNSITLMYHLFAKKQITYAKKAGFFYFFSSLRGSLHSTSTGTDVNGLLRTLTDSSGNSRHSAPALVCAASRSLVMQKFA